MSHRANTGEISDLISQTRDNLSTVELSGSFTLPFFFFFLLFQKIKKYSQAKRFLFLKKKFVPICISKLFQIPFND